MSGLVILTIAILGFAGMTATLGVSSLFTLKRS